MSSSLPVWPLKDTNVFHFKHHDQEKGYDVYKLNASKLSKNECHMFFPVPPCEELLIATALEFFTLHPANQQLNDKLHVNPIKCGGVELFWCRFPREYKDVCERIAELFKMTMVVMPRTIVLGGTAVEGTVIEFPAQENVLNFQGKRCHNTDKISNECKRIVALGNDLEKLGID